MVEVWLIRHGVTAWNVDRRWQGHSDIPLNKEGRQQAANVAAHMLRVHATTPFDRQLCSDLSRARGTAESVGKMLSLPVELDARFREEHYGLLEGHTTDEIKNCPILAAVHQARSEGPLAPNDPGESRQEGLDRAALALQFIAETFHHAKRIAVFTHGGFILNCFRHLGGYPAAYPVVKENKCPKIANTSISILKVESANDSHVWTAEQWGSTPHRQSRE
ncbi:hypothetical protein DYB34_001310 [Aphanomyces astaci]|uniref:Histidine phosphatase family protein n=1 Tax=Aphanomyces astaci TaxID=112090 RepID=A0A3R6VUN1_APHAT|nr:hypothetical protein DYB34_001310 [Aphanomyces astaci]